MGESYFCLVAEDVLTEAGLKNAAPSELIVMDSNYLDRLTIRRDIIAKHGSSVHGHVPEGITPVAELRSYLLGRYLPARFPTMFALSDKGESLKNQVTGRTCPTAPSGDADADLGVIAEFIEDDIFLLVQTPRGHRCVAFLCCFPAGFDPSEKLGKVLEEIHAPVPSYGKIGGSMERFFARVKVGEPVKRMNVSVLPMSVMENSD